MVCIEKRPYTLYGRLATLHFRYLTCLLDRGHIKLRRLSFLCVEIVNFVGVDGYSVLKRERPTQASQYAEWVG